MVKLAQHPRVSVSCHHERIKDALVMSSALQARLRRYCNQVFCVYMVCIGISSYCYHYSSNTYKRTRLTHRVALVANVLTLLLALPLVEWHTWQQIEFINKTVFKHPVVRYCNVCVFVLRTVTIAYTVLFRYSRDEMGSAIVDELKQLYENYLHRLPLSAARESYFNRVFFTKYACFLCVCSFEYLSQANMQLHSFGVPTTSWFKYVHIVLGGNVTIIMFATTLNNFLNMWYVCWDLCQINEYLQVLVDEMKLWPNDAHMESMLHEKKLVQLMDAHWRCAKMIQRLNDISRYQMLVLRFISFFETIIRGFWVCTYGFKTITFEINTILSLFSCFVNLIDLYLIDLVSDKTMKYYNETICILQNCNEFQQRCSRMENRCEEFALRLCSTKPHLSQCGLFLVDMRLWFRMLGSILMYTILLVQFYLIIGDDKN